MSAMASTLNETEMAGDNTENQLLPSSKSSEIKDRSPSPEYDPKAGENRLRPAGGKQYIISGINQA
jgi:hypothetical protein